MRVREPRHANTTASTNNSNPNRAAAKAISKTVKTWWPITITGVSNVMNHMIADSNKTETTNCTL